MKKSSNIPHVRPGDPIKASLFNRVLDSLPDPMSRGGPAGFPIYGPWFQAKNIGSTDLGMRDVAAVVGQEIGTNPQKQTSMFLSVRQAESGDDLDAIGVIIKPISAGSWGYVQTSGMAWVNAESSGDRGTLEIGNSNLVMGSAGGAQIIATSGSTFALIHWPVGSASSEAQTNWQFVWNEGE